MERLHDRPEPHASVPRQCLGVGPQVHRVLWNSYQPTNGLVKVPTIFSLAKERGLKTAMFVGKEKFKHTGCPAQLMNSSGRSPMTMQKSVAKVLRLSSASQTQPHLHSLPRPGHRRA